MIRSCTAPDGRPGYLWWIDGQQQVPECHPYDPGDPGSRGAAVRAALRDQPVEPVVAGTAATPRGGDEA